MDVHAGCVVADSFGNSYVLGDFAGTTITFGSITLTALIDSVATGDIFLVKLGRHGELGDN